jgi:hypothetical protein
MPLSEAPPAVRREMRLARVRRAVPVAAAGVVATAVGVWLEVGIAGGGWRHPVGVLLAAGAAYAAAHGAVEWLGARWRRAAERALERRPDVRIPRRPWGGGGRRRR